MAVNLPAYSTDVFSFGPGVMSLVAYATGEVATDISEAGLTDVGGVRSGGSVSIGRTRLDVFQGSPRALATTFVTEESASMTVNGIEWDIPNLANALGAGNVTGTTDAKLDFGGDLNVKSVAVKFRHQMPSGNTLSVRLWEAQAAGDFSVTFGDDLHEIPYTFNAVAVTGHWGVSAVANSKERLCQIQLEK